MLAFFVVVSQHAFFAFSFAAPDAGQSALDLCAIGRATNQRFVCYTHVERLKLEPGLAVRSEAVERA